MSADGSGRTGARRPPPGTAAAPRRQTATYRGIRWRKDPDGTIGWYHEGVGWRRWRPGADAPPLPPRWEEDAARIPVPPRIRRASWRSPYRLVPIVLAVGTVIFGVYQATRSSDHATATANREARALLGKCLEVTGTKDGSPTYSTTPVACSSSQARVEVVAVHDGRSGCSPSTTALQLSYAGTRTSDFECVSRVHR